MHKKILPIILYGLPTLFFLLAYFLVITSGEDLAQGASSPPDIINDAIAAFNHSARLSDMYAWSVINFFDYKFSFGIDTIFRLLDVAMAFGVLYLITNLAVGHRPKLQTKDALIFLLGFLAIMFTTHGKTIYSGFSMIHNYLPIALSLLVFITPYVYHLQKRKLPTKRTMMILMPIAGLIFGATSNLTPIALVLTFIATLIIWRIVSRHKLNWKYWFTSWQFFGLIGVIIGNAFCYLIGPGLNDYTSGTYTQTFDYLPLEQIFTDPLGSIGKIINHLVFNFGRFLAPIAIILICIFGFNYFTTKKFKIKLDQSTIKTLILLSTFVIMHLLIVTQIKYPVRIMFPAHIIGIVVLLILFHNIISKLQIKKLCPVLAISIIAAIILIIVRTTLAISYQNQVNWILEKIQDPEITEFCINPEDIRSKNLPYIYLGQEDMVVDWALPITTNNTTITYCK